MLHRINSRNVDLTDGTYFRVVAIGIGSYDDDDDDEERIVLKNIELAKCNDLLYTYGNCVDIEMSDVV